VRYTPPASLVVRTGSPAEALNIMLSWVIPPGRIIGRPPRSTSLERSSKVSPFGSDAFPKNSTQKAGSKLKLWNEAECGMDAPAAEAGMSSCTTPSASALPSLHVLLGSAAEPPRPVQRRMAMSRAEDDLIVKQHVVGAVARTGLNTTEAQSTRAFLRVKHTRESYSLKCSHYMRHPRSILGMGTSSPGAKYHIVPVANYVPTNQGRP
jgi:hypothetical protein